MQAETHLEYATVRGVAVYAKEGYAPAIELLVEVVRLALDDEAAAARAGMLTQAWLIDAMVGSRLEE